MVSRLESPWASEAGDVLAELSVSLDTGLDSGEVERRRSSYGQNMLKEVKTRSAWSILGNQFRSLIVVLLAAAGGVAFMFGDVPEGIAIAVVIVINTVIGFFTELKAVRSMEALRKLGSVDSHVRRGGDVATVQAQELVPGDIVLIEGGEIVTADLRIIDSSRLQADESALTGESVPVSKSPDALESDIPLAERSNMLYKGTSVTRGSAEAAVVWTGMDTELGRISSLVDKAEAESTPLEKRLHSLGNTLIWATLVIAAVVAAGGLMAGKDLFLMIETAIALAVAAIPEGLPIVATLALARGMLRMAERNALVNRLSAVETLGSTSVIATDKTGTLTENKMTVTQIMLGSGIVSVSSSAEDNGSGFSKEGTPEDPESNSQLRDFLVTGVLCSNASLSEKKSGSDGRERVGDPIEVALLEAAEKGGIKRSEVISGLPEEREEAFDSQTKMMATFHRDGDEYRVAVKGAPERIFDVCTSVLQNGEHTEFSDGIRKDWDEHNRSMAREGLRVLALAYKHVTQKDSAPYKNLTLLGLAGIMDPPRKEVRSAIDSCQDAGIRVVMMTGDQKETALAVARDTGLIDNTDSPKAAEGGDILQQEEYSEDERDRLLDVQVFCRVSPEQKLRLVDMYQKSGAVVAMTGDGVNDAPALKEADIGVAMGKRGTQVAREAADMVLKDDSFSTIVYAVEEGRVIFRNIRKFVLYLLSCNVSEIMAVSFASFLKMPLPILPLQILFLNLVTDVFPALALGMGEGDRDIMKLRPRDPSESILTRRHWGMITGYGILITASVLGALLAGLHILDLSRDQAVTCSFLTLGFAQLWHVFNMRDGNSSLIGNAIVRNPYIWAALLLCTGLLVSAAAVPGLSGVLKLYSPGFKGWILVSGMSLVPAVAGQVVMGISTFVSNR